MLLSILNTQPKNNFMYLGKFVYETKFQNREFLQVLHQPSESFGFWNIFGLRVFG